ncbi:MAG: DUF2007 domain-containing protein [Terriglobales bacterium]
MTLQDHDAERARLADVYSAMSNEELSRIAESGDEFSAAAQEALLAETSRRGLAPAIVAPPGEDRAEFDEFVTLRQFRDLPEALLAKSTLESAGIEALLADDNMIRLDWFYSNLLGGIKLKVREKDAEDANQILNQPIPEFLDVEGLGEYEQPKCPRCQSLDVSFQELNKALSYGSAYLGIPIPVHNKAWTCHACANQWEEESVSSPESQSGASS